MRRRLAILSVAVAALAVLLAPTATFAVDPPKAAFGGPLDGSQEAPSPVATSATGEGTVVISADESTITYIVEYSGLSGAVVAAHIHVGGAGVAGGVILPLTAGPSPMVGTLTATNFTASGAITTFAEAVAAIKAGGTYFNLHTAANPGGEIRGQIVAKGDALFAALDGDQEQTPVAGSGSGNGWVVISTDESTVTYYVAYSDLTGPAVAAHIHTGAAGTSGGVILPLTAAPSPMLGTLTSADFTASGSVATFADAIAAIRAGTTYFNVHTAANPSGEIRGQIGGLPAAPAPSVAPSVAPPPTSTVMPATPISSDASLWLALLATVGGVTAALVVRRWPSRRESHLDEPG
jgi:hypothetical protein